MQFLWVFGTISVIDLPALAANYTVSPGNHRRKETTMDTITISTPVIAALLFSVAALVIAPLTALIVLCIKKKLSFIPVLVGAAAFAVSQVLLRLPIMQALSTQAWYQQFAAFSPVLYIILIGGLSAGLFEESARYVGGRFLLREDRSYWDAISFGLGHGICEVLVLVGANSVVILIYAIMINTGNFASVLEPLPQETQDLLLSQMSSIGVGDLLAGVLERVFAVTYHVFATVLIFKGINEHKIRNYFYAIGAHTVLNTITVLALQLSGNIWLCELAALTVAFPAFYYIVKIKTPYEESWQKAKQEIDAKPRRRKRDDMPTRRLR